MLPSLPLRRASRKMFSPMESAHCSGDVSPAKGIPRFFAAAEAGLERTIAGWVPHFAAIAPVLAASDLLTTVPSLCMADSLHAYGLESRHVPFSIAPMPHALLWSASRRDDPEIKWLRDRLRPLVASRVAGFRADEPAAKRAG